MLQIPELWSTTAELVSYRSELKNESLASSSLPDCLNVKPSQTSNLGYILQYLDDKYRTETKVTPYIYEHCTFYLDEYEKFIAKEPHMEARNNGVFAGYLIAGRTFKFVKVVYRGQVPISVQNTTEFVDCVFEVQLHQEPTPAIKSFVLSLLTSDDPTRGTIKKS